MSNKATDSSADNNPPVAPNGLSLISKLQVKAELDKSQGEQTSKYSDYNDSRQKIAKFEMEIERLRQDNDR